MPAPSISSSVSANFVSPGATQQTVGNLTIGAGTVLVVGVLGSDAADPVDEAGGGFKVGGIALTQAFAGSQGTVWYLDDLSGLGTGSKSCTIQFNAGGYRAAATFYAVDRTGGLTLIDTTNGSGFTDNTPTLYTLPNMSGSITDAISFGFAHNNGFFAGNIVLGGDLVEDHDHNIASIRVKTFHDTTTPLGGHAYGNNATGGTMYMGMAMFGPPPDPDVTFAPDAFGVEVGFQSGVVFGPGGDVSLFPVRIGLDVGIQDGVRFAATGARQVMLTGSDLETPEMTEGGTEGYVLTYHADAPPTWDPVPAGGAHALDDHTDVNAPTPSNGDVLTWDSTPGEWVAAAPPGSTLTVKEVDGAPTATPVSTIRVTNGKLTDDGGGQVTLDLTGDATPIDWGEDADITTASFGDTAAANAGTEAAPAGHRHGMPANPVTGAAVMAALDFGEVGDIAASAPGDTAAAGASGEVADAAHRHARESYATITANLDFGESGDISATAPGDTAAAGSTGEVADAGHRHPRLNDTFALVIVIDGGGVTITTGIKGDLYCPFAFTMTAWRLLADAAGAIVIDLWKDTYTNYPPTDADAMPGAGKEPTIAATNAKAEDTSITDWTTDDVAAGDTIRWNVDSVTTIKRVTLVITCVRV